MSDAQVGRILVLILAVILGVWLVGDMSWKNKGHRLLFRISYVFFIINGVRYLVFDVLGLFPWN